MAKQKPAAATPADDTPPSAGEPTAQALLDAVGAQSGESEPAHAAVAYDPQKTTEQNVDAALDAPPVSADPSSEPPQDGQELGDAPPPAPAQAPTQQSVPRTLRQELAIHARAAEKSHDFRAYAALHTVEMTLVDLHHRATEALRVTKGEAHDLLRHLRDVI